MVKNLTRLSLALVALGLSAPVFAYSDSPFCVTVPNQQGGFTIGADALYWRPTSPDNNYAFVSGPLQTTNPSTSAQDFTVKGVNPNHNWGFDLNAAYRIPCTGNDISVEWVHLQQSSDNKEIVAPGAITSFELGNPNDVGVITSADGAIANTAFTDWDTGASTAKYRYDHVDLDVGQRVNFGCRFNFHLIAGVRWADVDHQRNSNFTVGNAPTFTLAAEDLQVGSTDEAAAVNDESEFRGFGPQLGFDGRYCLGYGFGFDAGAKASLLVGRTSITRDVSVIENLTPNNIGIDIGLPSVTVITLQHTDVESKNHVVPAFDANLGLDYTYNFNNCARSSLVIEAGYKVIHYWGASQFVGTFGSSSNSGNATDINHDHSVSFNGPYAGIKVNV